MGRFFYRRVQPAGFVFCYFLVHLGTQCLPPLSLRPVDAFGLESFSAAKFNRFFRNFNRFVLLDKKNEKIP